MLQKKRKGRLQKGIMVAVSALTVLASASTALAYQPMQSSDMSFEETISNNADFYGFGDFAFTIDLSQIDFSKSDCVFVDENGQQEPVYNIGSERALCTHSMVEGYYYVHEKLSSGGCRTKIYNAQRCKKCGYLANAVYSHTVTSTKCTH